MKSGLVQVRRGRDFVVGSTRSFDEGEIASDLAFEGMPNTYDDASNPIACPRSYEANKRKIEKSRRNLTLLRRLQWFISFVTLIGGLLCIAGSVLLAKLPLFSLLILGIGLWLIWTAWDLVGDAYADTHGTLPWWSFRRIVPKRRM